MGAIAEGLVRRLAAGTPEIGLAGLYLDGKGGFLGNFGAVGHLALLKDGGGGSLLTGAAGSTMISGFKGAMSFAVPGLAKNGIGRAADFVPSNPP
jgi:hypothetical protein